MPYFVYLLKTTAGTYYVGLTTDVKRRLEEHKKGKGGAKYTRAFGADEVVYVEEYPNRSEASKREYELKQLTRNEKIKMIGRIANAEISDRSS